MAGLGSKDKLVAHVYRGPCHEQYRAKRRIPSLPPEERKRLRKQASDLEQKLRSEWRNGNRKK
jgi:hypothetical protein